VNAQAAVIGAGSWGTALAVLLAENGLRLTLHCHREDVANAINRSRHNPEYFPEVELPPTIAASTNMADALAAELVLLAVPTNYLQPVFTAWMDDWLSWSARGGMLCSCSKGLLLDPVRRVDSWLAELLPDVRLAQLSGPNLASEIVQGQPAAAVVNGDPLAASAVQAGLNCPRFRVYTGTDITGAEVAGFYKNIIAIAAGIVHGLGLGDNTRAALMARGLTEMTRLATYFGGDAQTLYGLAGVGDLIVTCGSPLSRNFRSGMLRAQGQNLEQIVSTLTAPGGGRAVAEGIQASRALHEWPLELSSTAGTIPQAAWPELPIAREVYLVMHENADPREAIARLMSRPPRQETDHA
jgi:glycerol-3-phosphate dehydrogenase (NAD(P)+)